MAVMHQEPRSRLADGRLLVPVVLGVLGVMFALSALPFEPSASKVVLNVVALVMLAAGGASLAVALDAVKRRQPGDQLPK